MDDLSKLSPLATPQQLAERCQVTQRMLAFWRNRGDGPRFLRMPKGVIRYRLADIEAWEQSIREGPPAPRIIPAAGIQGTLIKRASRFGGYQTKRDRREAAARPQG